MPRARRLALASLTFFAALGVAPGSAQQGQPVFQPIVSNYDYDSSTATYCVLGPQQQSATFTEPTTGQAISKIETSGSSTTTTASTGSTAFTTAGLAEGSELTVTTAAGQSLTREVTAVAGATSLTVHSAWNLSSTSWAWRNLTCGTGVGAGWFGVSGLRDKLLTIQVDQISLASSNIAITVRCKGPSPWSTTGNLIYPPTGGSGQCGTGLFTTAGSCSIWIPEPHAFCRIGVAVAADDAGDTGANKEQITAYLEAYR